MATKRGRMVTYLTGLLPKSHLTLWSHVHAQGHNTNENHYISTKQSVYGHQIQQGDNLNWWAPTYRSQRPFDYMITWQIKTINATALPMTTRLGTVMIYLQGLLLI